jgi:Lar family restriction alleviation protein
MMQRYRQSPNDGPMLADEAGPWVKVEAMTTPLQAQELAKSPVPVRECPFEVEGLLPCPFCGGEAEILEITEGDEVANIGGSVVTCRQCGASSPVHFDRKENLEDSWNRRAARTPLASVEGADTDDTWRDLALQFDGHRIEALALLRYVADGLIAAELPRFSGEVRQFLSAPPLAGEKVLAKRIAALAQSGRSSAEPVAWASTDFVWKVNYNGEATVHDKVDDAWPIPLYLTPPVGPQEAVAVTDEMVRKASNEYLMHKGERPWRVLRGGQELWETCALAMRAALVAALSPSGNDLRADRTALVDRLERAAAAYERLGKVTRDDEKSREIRKAAIAELAEARKALLA